MADDSRDVPRGLIDIGESIRNLRGSQGLTQEQLSTMAMVSTATIKRLESYTENWHPRRRTLKNLSRALGLNEMHLIDIYEGREPKILPAKPEATRKVEDFLGEIFERLSAMGQRLDSIDKRLDSIDTALGRAPRPDMTADPPETET